MMTSHTDFFKKNLEAIRIVGINVLISAYFIILNIIAV